MPDANGNIHTPWGFSDHVKTYGDGITFYGTPSHGGFRLLAKQNRLVPRYFQEATWGKLGLTGWYEEDCDYCFVVLCFPDRFTADNVKAAREVLSWHHKAQLEQFDRERTKVQPRLTGSDFGGAFDGFTVTSDSDSGL